MSRGPGALQREILRVVGRHAGRALSRGEVQWELAEAGPGRITSGAEPQLTDAFYKSFSRAWGALRDARQIEPVAVPLRNADEAELHYPHKTRSATLRAMRIRLLPPLLRYAVGQPPVFSPQELERRARQRAEEAEDALERRQLWDRIETRLITIAGDPTTRAWALMVIAKGRSLYVPNARMGTGATHEELLRLVPSSVPVDVASDLRRLFQLEYPPDRVAMWRFKAILYRVVRFHRDGDGKPQLKPDAARVLYDHDPAYVSSLPGFRREQTGFYHMGSGERMFEVRHSEDLIARLVDRHILEEFEVLHGPGTPAATPTRR